MTTKPIPEQDLQPGSLRQAAPDAVQAVLSQDHGRLERHFRSIVGEATCQDPAELREAWSDSSKSCSATSTTRRRSFSPPSPSRGLSTSSVQVWIDLASVDTEEVERDEQVRSAEFFDVANFPQAKFSSTEVQLREHANPIVKGRLDLHGVTAEVALEVTRLHRSIDDQRVERISYEVKGRLDRRQFGLRWNQDLDVGGVVAGDRIEILAQLEATRATAAP